MSILTKLVNDDFLIAKEEICVGLVLSCIGIC